MTLMTVNGSKRRPEHSLSEVRASYWSKTTTTFSSCSILTYSIGLKLTQWDRSFTFCGNQPKPEVRIWRSKRQEVACVNIVQITFHMVLCLFYTYWDVNACLTERIKSTRRLFNSGCMLSVRPCWAASLLYFVTAISSDNLILAASSMFCPPRSFRF